jgi:ribosomal protein L11 methyltransferase
MFLWSKLSSEQWADAWLERFAGNPQLHPVITSFPNKTRIRVEVYAETRRTVEKIQREWGGSVREVKNRNWAAAQSLPDLMIRDQLVITAERAQKTILAKQKRHPERHVIAIPADMAFGTGHHATTATVLRFLVDAAARYQQLGQPWTMADLGCGSGILAIAARKLGAQKVWGCDFDAKAVSVSEENAELNGVPEVKFTSKDVLKWQPKQAYDIVAANIFVDVLEAAFPQIIASVKSGGVLMISGILKTHAENCLSLAALQGIQWQRVITKGKWVSAWGLRTA